MKTDSVTIELPATLYAELQSLASDEHPDPVDVIAYLLATARE